MSVAFSSNRKKVENQLLALLHLKTKYFWGRVYERNIKKEVHNRPSLR